MTWPTSHSTALLRAVRKPPTVSENLHRVPGLESLLTLTDDTARQALFSPLQR